MKCPYCKKEVIVENRVKYNVEAYGDPVRARTSCCGAIVRVHRIVTFDYTETSQEGKDDWGN